MIAQGIMAVNKLILTMLCCHISLTTSQCIVIVIHIKLQPSQNFKEEPLSEAR